MQKVWGVVYRIHRWWFKNLATSEGSEHPTSVNRILAASLPIILTRFFFTINTIKPTLPTTNSQTPENGGAYFQEPFVLI